MTSKILVLGSRGKTGKRVYSRLIQKGIVATPASRSASIPFDWYDADTWARALKGHDKVYVSFQPDLAVPGSLDIISAFVAAAQQGGVKKLVLLSGRGEHEAQACEDVVMKSGLDWTIIRASFFMQNFSEGFWFDAIRSGAFVVPVVNAKEPFVDVDDLADVAVASLLDDAHNSRIYEVTGPELLSFSQAIAKIAAPLKREIKLVELNMEEYVAMLKVFGVPEEEIWLIRYLFTEVLDGRNESLSPDVEKVLQRKAGSFAAYAQRTADGGIWSAD